MIDVPAIMQTLATQRPIFHSEADFQHAFAWEIHRRLPDAQVRLELPFTVDGRRLHLDIWASHQGSAVAIELKCPTRKLAVQVDGESVRLATGAVDLTCYEFSKDVGRLERITSDHANTTGYAIMLTNDNLHWTAGPGTTGAAFRLPEGRQLQGTMTWSAHAGTGTTEGYEKPLTLNRSYAVRWQRYAQVGSDQWGRFRWLAVHVPGEGER